MAQMKVYNGSSWVVVSDLPTVGSGDKGKYLHTNSSTGALEWSKEGAFNLLGNAGSVNASNVTVYFYANIIKGKTYTFHLEGGTGSGAYGLWTELNGVSVQEITSSTGYNASKTFTATSNANLVGAYINSATNRKAVLNEGSTSISYDEATDVPVCLWRNGSPTATSFASARVSVAGMSNYKYLVFEFRATGNFSYGTQFITISPEFTTTKDYLLSCGDQSDQYTRKVTIDVTNYPDKVYFGTGYVGSNAYNACIVPVAIYGKNEL